MAKFKIGDHLKLLNHTGPRVLKVIALDDNSFEYQIEIIQEDQAYPYQFKGYRFFEYYSLIEQNYELIPNQGASSPNPKFKIGDRIKTAFSKNIYRVVGITDVWYIIQLDGINNIPQQIRKSDITFSLVTEETPLTIQKEKQCSCTSHDLFIKGCTCGYIKRYKEKWSS